MTNSASNETEVKLQESIRGKEVYIIQSGSKRVNNDVMEMMTMIYACKTSSARKIVGNSSVRSSGLGIGKRYVPEKEYIHMISSYITADWRNIK